MLVWDFGNTGLTAKKRPERVRSGPDRESNYRECHRHRCLCVVIIRAAQAAVNYFGCLDLLEGCVDDNVEPALAHDEHTGHVYVLDRPGHVPAVQLW